MSVPETVLIRCPGCGGSIDATMYPCIDERVPDAAGRVMSGELFRYTCPHCGRKDRLEYDLLFRDTDHRLWIQVVHDPAAVPAQIEALRGMEETASLRVRIVRNIRELREKLMAFMLGRDDRILEIYKLIALSQFAGQAPGVTLSEKPLYAGDLESGGEVIAFYGRDGRRELAPLDEGFYQLLQQRYAPRLKGETDCFVYDDAWAAGFTPELG